MVRAEVPVGGPNGASARCKMRSCWLEVEAPSLPNRRLHLAQRAGAGLSFDGELSYKPATGIQRAFLPVVGAEAPLLGTTGASARSSALGWSWFDSRCCATLTLAIGTRQIANGYLGCPLLAYSRWFDLLPRSLSNPIRGEPQAASNEQERPNPENGTQLAKPHAFNAQP